MCEFSAYVAFNQRLFLTSRVFWFIFLNSSSRLCFRFFWLYINGLKRKKKLSLTHRSDFYMFLKLLVFNFLNCETVCCTQRVKKGQCFAVKPMHQKDTATAELTFDWWALEGAAGKAKVKLPRGQAGACLLTLKYKLRGGEKTQARNQIAQPTLHYTRLLSSLSVPTFVWQINTNIQNRQRSEKTSENTHEVNIWTIYIFGRCKRKKKHWRIFSALLPLTKRQTDKTVMHNKKTMTICDRICVWVKRFLHRADRVLSSVSFSSRWCLCAREGPYYHAPHPVSQEFPPNVAVEFSDQYQTL